jgi:hypothetical protein
MKHSVCLIINEEKSRIKEEKERLGGSVFKFKKQEAPVGGLLNFQPTFNMNTSYCAPIKKHLIDKNKKSLQEFID